MQKSEEQEKIEALTAELNSYKNQHSELKKVVKKAASQRQERR